MRKSPLPWYALGALRCHWLAPGIHLLADLHLWPTTITAQHVHGHDGLIALAQDRRPSAFSPEILARRSSHDPDSIHALSPQHPIATPRPSISMHCFAPDTLLCLIVSLRRAKSPYGVWILIGRCWEVHREAVIIQLVHMPSPPPIEGPAVHRFACAAKPRLSPKRCCARTHQLPLPERTRLSLAIASR